MIRVGGHLFAPDDRGLSIVEIDDGRVRSIEAVNEPSELNAAPEVVGGSGLRVIPGLVDIQLNGAFGHDFADPDADLALVCRRLPELGVTAFCPTIVTSPLARYPAALANLRRAPAAGEARVLGTHVEGPFLSPEHPGTHDPRLLRLPDAAARADAQGWLEDADVRWLTLAPELPGALELIRLLVDRGIRVSMGHTGATWSEAEAGARAGASLVTHLFNAMRPFRHRDPGIAGFSLASSLPVGVIADGHHLAFETLRLIARVKAPGELYLVTDALAGLGMPPGRYVLAGREYVSDGTCGRLPDGTLSGSLLPMPLAIRNLVESAGLPVDLAVRMATANPARALGFDDGTGEVRVGRRADLVVVDEAWGVVATIAGGKLAYRRPGAAGAPAVASVRDAG